MTEATRSEVIPELSSSCPATSSGFSTNARSRCPVPTVTKATIAGYAHRTLDHTLAALRHARRATEQRTAPADDVLDLTPDRRRVGAQLEDDTRCLRAGVAQNAQQEVLCPHVRLFEAFRLLLHEGERAPGKAREPAGRSVPRGAAGVRALGQGSSCALVRRGLQQNPETECPEQQRAERRGDDHSPRNANEECGKAKEGARTEALQRDEQEQDQRHNDEDIDEPGVALTEMGAASHPHNHRAAHAYSDDRHEYRPQVRGQAVECARERPVAQCGVCALHEPCRKEHQAPQNEGRDDDGRCLSRWRLLSHVHTGAAVAARYSQIAHFTLPDLPREGVGLPCLRLLQPPLPCHERAPSTACSTASGPASAGGPLPPRTSRRRYPHRSSCVGSRAPRIHLAAERRRR